MFSTTRWSKEMVTKTLREYLTRSGQVDPRRWRHGRGLPRPWGAQLRKFREGGLRRAGGGEAGMFSAVIGGWGASGTIGSSPVTHEIRL